MISRLKEPSGQPAAIENLQLCFAGDEIIFSSKDSNLIINIFSCPAQGWPEATPRGRALSWTGKYENPHGMTPNLFYLPVLFIKGFQTTTSRRKE
jgi:hypothetical protein